MTISRLRLLLLLGLAANALAASACVWVPDRWGHHDDDHRPGWDYDRGRGNWDYDQDHHEHRDHDDD